MSLKSTVEEHNLSPDSKWETLDSFLPLLQILQNLEVYHDCHILVGPTEPENWKEFVEAAGNVRTFRVTKRTWDDDTCTPTSTLTQLALQLKGTPLFPALTKLQIKVLDTFSRHLPLLMSPSLEEVELDGEWLRPGVKSTSHASKDVLRTQKSSNHVPTAAEIISSIKVLLKLLASTLPHHAPNIKVLRIWNMQSMNVSLLNHFANLRHLRLLELNQVTDVEGFDGLSCLGSLTNLETLYLKLVASSVIRTHSPPTRSENFLPALIDLGITGPSEVIADLLYAIGSTVMKRLVINCPSVAVRRDESDEEVDFSNTKRRESGKKKAQFGFHTPKPAPTNPVSMFAPVKDQWTLCLEEIDIITGPKCVCDLRDLAELKVFRKLRIRGSEVTSLERTFAESAVWSQLQSLWLPTDFVITLSQLRSIAVAAPFLVAATLHLSIDDVPAFKSAASIEHALKNLTIDAGLTDHPRAASNLDSQTPDFEGLSDEEEWSNPAKVARHLFMLFPRLESLKAVNLNIRQWEDIWEMVRLCQAASMDDRKRRPVRMSGSQGPELQL